MFRAISEQVGHEVFVPGSTDAHGNPTESWAPAVEVGIYAFDPGSTSEPREGAHRVIVEPTIYFPSSVSLGHRDRVNVRGDLHEVEGKTREWIHPTDPTRRANVATLRRVEG